MSERLAEIKASPRYHVATGSRSFPADDTRPVLINDLLWLIAEVERLEATITDMTRGNTGTWGKKLKAEGMEQAAKKATETAADLQRRAVRNHDAVATTQLIHADALDAFADTIRAEIKGQT